MRLPIPPRPRGFLHDKAVGGLMPWKIVGLPIGLRLLFLAEHRQRLTPLHYAGVRCSVIRDLETEKFIR